jgi:hypothetical protein
MTPPPTDRYHICVDVGERSTDYAWHIIDTEVEYTERRSLFEDLKDEYVKELRRYREQNICPFGNTIHGEAMQLSAANEHLNTQKDGFTGDPPEKVCSYCWNEVKNRIKEQQQTDNITDIEYPDTGFRLRWKQKGRAREEWYDILVAPETTFDELDSLVVSQLSKLDYMHARLYGLEDEYLDSSLDIHGGIMEGIVDKPTTRSPPITIKEVFENNELTVGDRLSLAYDLGTHRSFYCIIKEKKPAEQYDPAQFNDSEIIAATETAVVTRSKETISTNESNTTSSSTSSSTDQTTQETTPSTEEDDTTFEDALDTFSDNLNNDDTSDENMDFSIDVEK